MRAVRIAFVVKEQDLRIVSAIARARDFSDNIHIFDFDSKDESKQLAIEEGVKVHEMHPDSCLPEVAVILDEEEFDGNTLVVNLDFEWKLRDLPVGVNQARGLTDVLLVFKSNPKDENSIASEALTYADAIFHTLSASPAGIAALAAAGPHDLPMELPKELLVRVIRKNTSVAVNQRESLATASRFAQLFYWMIESRHPLISFGVPGIVLFTVGYLLSRDVISSFEEINSVSLGVALATFVVTIVGLLAMMIAIILYILGKQVKQVQLQHQEWPKE
ncbi:MAG TPA: hypothetical protein EYQ53_03805 [Candidatus Poseidoniales archaeon]|nr:MAG: hypothetical protein CXT69_01070 [Euryarchaeota archaeon]HIG03489.1 hypothetical protein [Candidatus Poseidoniales archaeon]HIK77780.1 hypothetical protein [Candidatus Poseidoniales archaeon]